MCVCVPDTIHDDTRSSGLAAPDIEYLHLFCTEAGSDVLYLDHHDRTHSDVVFIQQTVLSKAQTQLRDSTGVNL